MTTSKKIYNDQEIDVVAGLWTARVSTQAKLLAATTRLTSCPTSHLDTEKHSSIDAARIIAAISVAAEGTMASLRSIIQREIITVKHALANNIPHEGVAPGDDLELMLKDLQTHRAEVIAASHTKSDPTDAGMEPVPKESPAQSTPEHHADSSPEPQRFQTPPPPAPRNGTGGGGSCGNGTSSNNSCSDRDKFTRLQIPTHAPSGSSSNGEVGKRPGLQRDSEQAKAQEQNEKSSSSRKRSAPSGHARRDNRPSKERPQGILRRIRRSIGVGDVLSVLLDVRLAEGWSRQWVRGKVLKNMSRSGVFEIAFDHDKAGQPAWKSEVQSDTDEGDVGNGEDIKWIHQQRLEIESRHYFCGRGTSPPVGVDDIHPKGSWYLHAP